MGTGRLTTTAVLGWVLAACATLGCGGPRVQVSDVREHQTRTGVVRVEAVLQNSGGAGQVKLHVRLHDRRSGRAIAASRTVEVERHERLDTVIDVPANAGDYTATVTAVYPPD